MRFEVTYTPADLAELERLARNPSQRKPSVASFAGWIASILAVLALAMFLPLRKNPEAVKEALSRRDDSSWPTSPFVWVWMLGIFGLFIYSKLRSPAAARFRDNSLLQTAQIVDVLEEGITVESAHNKTIWRWDAVEELLESDAIFAIGLRVLPSGFVLIPKRGIASEELDGFRALVQSKIQK